jgi:hypothetical protein
LFFGVVSFFTMENEEAVAVSSEFDHESKLLKRTVKPLPPELGKVNTNNMGTIIHCALETYKQGNDLVEHVLVQYAEIRIEDNGEDKWCRRNK